MIPGRYDPAPIEVGTAWADDVFKFLQADGSAWNLTGVVITMVFRDTNGAVKLTLSDGSGLTINRAAGTVAPVVTNAQSAALGVGSFKYDLYFEYPAGITKSRQTGILEVERK